MKFVVTEPRENLVKVRVYTEGKSLNEIVKVLEKLTPAFGNAQLMRLIQKSSQPHKTPTPEPPQTPAHTRSAAAGNLYAKPATS